MNWQTHSRTLAAAAGALGIFVGAGSALASPPGYYLVGHPSDAPEGTISSVGGLSHTGVATGYYGRSFYRNGFIFTPESGRVDLPRHVENETPLSTAIGISGNAQTVVGYVVSSSTGFDSKAFRYTSGGSIELLANIGSTPTSSEAWGASHDASTIVGFSSGGPAFWRGDAGYQLPDIGGSNRGGLAYDVDSAGTTAVGVSAWGSVTDPYPAAVKWSLETRTLTRLSSFFNDPNELSSAHAISGDGRTIVGKASPFFGNDQAIRWDENGIAHSLGVMPGSFSDEAWDVSHDGSVIVGHSRFGNDWRAFIWMEDSGIMLLDEYLDSLGFTLPEGWHSERAYAVSGDGLTIAGRARSINEEYMGYVVTIPNPATLLILTSPYIMFGRRRCTP